MKGLLRSLRGRILLLFLAVIVFQAGATSAFLLFQLGPHMVRTYEGHQRQMTGALGWELNNLRQKVQGYSVNILGDRRIQDFLLRAGESPEAPALGEELRNLILSYTGYDNFIGAIYLVDNRGRVYSNNKQQAVVGFIHNRLGAVAASDGSALWESAFSPATVVMYRAVHDVRWDLNRKIGALFLVIDRRMFSQTAEKFALDPRQGYALQSEDGLLALGAPPPAAPGEYVMSRYERDAWVLQTWLHKAAVSRPARQLLLILAGELLGSLLLTTALVVYMSGRLTGPVREMKRAMRRLGGGQLDTAVPVLSKDELGELARAFNHMATRIETLVERVRQDERERRALELKTMQYQINPHFLYNALDSVNMLARKGDGQEICALVTSLSNLFRLSLNHGQDFITVADEVQHMRYYLDIQSLRFPGAFTWEAAVQEGLGERRILKFLLQPLVENSLNHGLRNSVEPGRIAVRIFSESGALVLRVEDNGAGMTPEALAIVQRTLDEPDREPNPYKGGFGLRNVHQRLKLYYPGSGGLEIESEFGEGTRITIRLPA